MADTNYAPPSFRNINKAELKNILSAIEKESRESCGYVIIDVRGDDEVAATGKISSVVETLPLPYIAQSKALAMEPDDFLENFGFEKPNYDETIVFSCKAGIRSQMASQIAVMEGYTDVLNYVGGSNEWFSSE
eukprot:CAMPEP_0172415198 /NCGR_PEP_ID=MMETSP1064-20121228/1677_1 /TAXON_ID=202472 /ORGANISM="Aulacoseira subarctica , Strain CCAP 1002/5" /LENGTH=132 /DNA_ID=CAMNT_0013152109 /DNA_START=224 /DNA_END=622 /DNA_ORIENTATION=+